MAKRSRKSVRPRNEPQRNRIAWPIPDPPTALIEACAQGDLVLFVGSGVSAPAGYPTWRTFVEHLLRWRQGDTSVDSKLSASWNRSLADGDANAVADSILSDPTLTKEQIADFIKSVFDSSNRSSSWTKLLPALRPSAVLTTNFDDLLEQEFPLWKVLTPNQAEGLLEQETAKHSYILKLYGRFQDPSSLLIAPMQFELAMDENRLFAKYMEAMFTTRTILFLGTSVNGIDAYLRGMRLGVSALPERHYALIADDHAVPWQTKADLLSKRFGIRFLPFVPGPKFENFPKVLSEWAAQMSSPPAVHSTVRPDERVWLKHVVVEDIGPFDHQEFELSHDWNVLIGDNGVGKSTILKAIAVAMCGDDAREFAGRLVKVGRSRGRVLLTTNTGDRYQTEIFAKDGFADVRSVPSRPIEAQRWLALGFPALRAIPRNRPSEVLLKSKRRLTADDLLPLLMNETDYRSTSVRRWLTTLAYQSTHKDAAGAEAGKQLEGFKKAIGHLLKLSGIKIETITPDSGDVIVRTADGLLPLEAVSQGAASLFGWMAVLLQRKADLASEPPLRPAIRRTKKKTAAPALDQPPRRPMLVLVDEIDAHLHPMWQWSLLDLVRELCPDTQFIATTHSPLIAGALSAGQLHSLRRVGAHGNVVVTRIEETLVGYRADQILTHDAFGMPTSRSREIEQKRTNYESLIGKRNLKADERKLLASLRSELNETIPLSGETISERVASQQLEEFLARGVREMEPDQRSRVIAEAEKMFVKLGLT